MTIGYKIKRLREIKGLKQEYMAEVLEMSQQSYSRIENGKSKLSHDQLKKIAETFEVPVEDLDNWDGDFVFNNYGNNYTTNGQINHQNTLPDSERDLYKTLIAKQEEAITHLKSIVERLLSK